MIYHWMVTVLLFCKPSLFLFFCQHSEMQSWNLQELCVAESQTGFKTQIFLVRRICQKILSNQRWPVCLMQGGSGLLQNPLVSLAVRYRKPHSWYPSPPTDRSHASIWWHVLCDASLAAAWSPCCSPSLQKGTPAGLVMFFFSSPKSQSWSSAALGLLLRGCLLLLECHGVCCELSILMP